jgi:membrane protease YdiL (CAAX protease family)
VISLAAGVPSLGFAGLLHVTLFAIVLPVAAWRSQVRLARMDLPAKRPYFVGVLSQQAVFLGISLAVARALDLRLPLGPPDARGLLLAAGFLALALLTLAPFWRSQVKGRSRFVYLVAPRTAEERALWAGVSLLAGVGEEISYRGVLFVLLTALLPIPAAVAVAALAFGVAHLVQGWRAAPIVFAFAVGFQLLVLATGSLLPAMAAHVLYDLIAGLSYGRLADRYDYPREPMPPPSLGTRH